MGLLSLGTYIPFSRVFSHRLKLNQAHRACLVTRDGEKYREEYPLSTYSHIPKKKEKKIYVVIPRLCSVCKFFYNRVRHKSKLSPARRCKYTHYRRISRVKIAKSGRIYFDVPIVVFPSVYDIRYWNAHNQR